MHREYVQVKRALTKAPGAGQLLAVEADFGTFPYKTQAEK
jgi:hypothetical protein